MSFGKTAIYLCAALALTLPCAANAQAPDLSPILLIESGPSDNPNYRRMVFVKYLSNNGVMVSYKAYNRSEFIQIEDATPSSLVASCLNGKAATLADINAFNRAEAAARANAATPAIEHFCIKGVTGWEAGNRSVYLDPIFEGMPHAAALNN